MKKLLFLVAVMMVSAVTVMAAGREGLTEFKLDNGLTVMLWEDHEQPNVLGYVAVRAGSVDEPKDYTGLAHYLEHMMFKGTQKIGALDWEAEKPMYDSIVALYDQYCDATDPAVREQLATQINEISLREAKISSTEDFFSMLDILGAENVNAGTSYDYTVYYNSFPEAEMQRWLTLFSDRFIHPVFRTFQAELENVFEEYNMYANEPSSQVSNKIHAEVYSGCPYERDIIGTAEHLKNPRLSKLIEFYNTWYVANNMALIMVGDFDAEAAKPMITAAFSRIENRPLPERPVYAETNLTGMKAYKLGYQPEIVWAYPGCTQADPDQEILEFVCALLSNGSTGLLDKLNIDGDVTGVYAYSDSRRNTGRVMIEAIPYYDANQKMFETNKATEKVVMAQVERLKNGDIPDWVIASVKRMYDINYKLSDENATSKVYHLLGSFLYGIPVDVVLSSNERIQALTKEDIMRVAKKYFNANHLTLSFDEGTMKSNPLPKPKIKPLEPVKDAHTAYAEAFSQMPKGQLKQTFCDLGEVTLKELSHNVTLHYTPNNKNDIFTLNLRYGAGEHAIPMLPYATVLMKDAGVMPSTEPQDFKRQLAELGATVDYSCDDSYFHISITGEEENYEKIMNAISRQLLMPKLEQKKLDNIKGSIFFSRYSRAKKTAMQKAALVQYALYGDKSPYIDEVKFTDIWAMGLPQVQSVIAQARSYALDVFYCGAKPIDEVVKNLPLTQGMKDSESPYIKERKSYDKPTVLFLPNSTVQQADLYFYINGSPYNIAQDVASDAFNQYFSGGFSGLVLNEIRVKRSMAYSAYGANSTPQIQGKDQYFIGYVGTQSDKVVDAIRVYMSLLDSMPVNEATIAGVRAAIKQAAQTAKPSMRSKGRYYSYLQQLGYTDDPARVNSAEMDALSFEVIEQFYKEHIQGKPVTVILMGDPKKIDLKAIETRLGCKVTKLTTGKLFAPLETDF